MATYITLSTFTDQGLKSVKDTVKRAEAVKEAAGKFGVTLQSIHWTQGQYDIVGVWEAKDELSIAALGLAIAQAGNVSTQTLRAFSRDDMTAILAKLP
jgi:uncharacterized protein with GYD domain